MVLVWSPSFASLKLNSLVTSICGMPMMEASQAPLLSLVLMARGSPLALPWELALPLRPARVQARVQAPGRVLGLVQGRTPWRARLRQASAE